MSKVVTLILINQLVSMGIESGDAAWFIVAGAIGGIFVSITVTVGILRLVRGLLMLLANLAVLIGLFLIFLSAIFTLVMLSPPLP